MFRLAERRIQLAAKACGLDFSGDLGDQALAASDNSRHVTGTGVCAWDLPRAGGGVALMSA